MRKLSVLVVALLVVGLASASYAQENGGKGTTKGKRPEGRFGTVVKVDGTNLVIKERVQGKDEPLVKPTEAADRVAVMEAMYEGSKKSTWVKIR